MRLRHIATVDFRFSERTNYLALMKKYPKLGELAAQDVVLFRSFKGDQLLFIYGFGTVNGVHGPRTFLRSERLRLEGGAWNPLMLADYAEQVGLHLDGIKKFEEHMKTVIRELDKVVRKVTANLTRRVAARTRGGAHASTPASA